MRVTQEQFNRFKTNSLNAKIENKQSLGQNEMENLHLPRCDKTASTNKILSINVARTSH